MSYLLLIIAFVIFGWQLSKKIFYWETVVKFLWKQVYEQSDRMVTFLKIANDNKESEDKIIEDFRKVIGLRGDIINSIINYINSEKDKEVEEETFGYGRYDFNKILTSAKQDPNCFKGLK